MTGREAIRQTGQRIGRAIVSRDAATLLAVWTIVVSLAAAFSGVRVPGEIVLVASLTVYGLVRTLRSDDTPAGAELVAAAVVTLALLPLGSVAFGWIATIAFCWTNEGRRSEAPEVVATDATSIFGKSANQTPTRTDVDGGLLIEGQLVAPGELSREVLHVPFVPALDRTPKVELEPTDGETIATLEDVTPFGFRLTVQGGGTVSYAAFLDAA